MSHIYLTGSGVYTPPYALTNEEVVSSFNQYVDLHNQQSDDKLTYSSAEFIEKASGIKQRYVMDKKGIINPNRMRPYYPKRPDTEISIQAEMALPAIHQDLRLLLHATGRPDLLKCPRQACGRFPKLFQHASDNPRSMPA